MLSQEGMAGMDESAPDGAAQHAAGMSQLKSHLICAIAALPRVDQIDIVRALDPEVLGALLPELSLAPQSDGAAPQNAPQEAPLEALEKCPTAADLQDLLEERRAEHRLRTLKSGKVVRGAMFSSTDCDIRDLSAAGCRLSVDNPFHIPERFELALNATGEHRPVRVIWRRGREIGVAFE